MNFAQYILSKVAIVSKNECATLSELNKESDSSKEKKKKELENWLADYYLDLADKYLTKYFG